MQCGGVGAGVGGTGVGYGVGGAGVGQVVMACPSAWMHFSHRFAATRGWNFPAGHAMQKS